MRYFHGPSDHPQENRPGKHIQVMANHVTEKFNKIRSSPGRRKALVIMNYRHAFPHLLLQQDGKWDAAFAVRGHPSLGFSFPGSPFGADEFDYFAVPSSLGKKYQDIFTGYVFFKPLDERRLTFGIPGLLDPSFAGEMLRRCQITGQTQSADQVAMEIAESQTVRTCGYENKEVFPKSEYAEKIQRGLQPAGGPASNSVNRPSAAAVAPSGDRSKRPPAASVVHPRRPAPRLRRY